MVFLEVMGWIKIYYAKLRGFPLEIIWVMYAVYRILCVVFLHATIQLLNKVLGFCDLSNTFRFMGNMCCN